MSGQVILCIDASSQPGLVQLVEVEGRKARILQSFEAEVSSLFNPSRLLSLSASPSEDLTQSGDMTADTRTSSEEPPSSPAPDASADPHSASKQPELSELADSLSAILSEVSQPYTAAVLIIPTPGYLSLNLDLPFSEPKQIQKILDFEVQDRVPFETTEFLIEHRVLPLPEGLTRSEGHDVHVSIIPRKFMSAVLKVCKAAQFEPLIVTTPASCLEGLFVLAPEYFSDNSGVLYAIGDQVHMGLRIHGRMRMDRILVRSPALGSSSFGSSEPLKQLGTELKLSLVAAETRYAVKIDTLYALGDSLEPRELSSHVGRLVESVTLADLFGADSPAASTPNPSPAALAAPFAQDDPPQSILTNFRTREFSYSLQLSELLSGLRRLGPSAAAVAMIAAVWLLGSYIYRDITLQNLTQEMARALESHAPDIVFEPGQEVAAITTENAKLDRALESLGSGSLDQFTALDILREISQVMPNNPGITVRGISIKGNRVKLVGSAPEYKDVEAIERALKRSRSMKFRAKPPELSAGLGAQPGGARSGQNFTFDIRVEE